ncbi:DUF4129 domain-containing transglutaminase family protein [Paenibacillus sp. SI8]|uniref:DUF4129 domain-containing transglutaminase family protein n=1 Tax=unclassified Paenibacillus TaxID=185978 RepID=UPI00346639E1
MQPLEPNGPQGSVRRAGTSASRSSSRNQFATRGASHLSSQNQFAARGASHPSSQNQFTARGTSRSSTQNRFAARGASRSSSQNGSPAQALVGSSPSHAGGSLIRDLMISLLLFLLLTEWLRPLPLLADVSEIYTIQPFLIVFALCIAIDCFRVPYTWGWFAKSLIILLFVGFMFDREAFLGGSWIIDLMEVISHDVSYLLQGQLDLISGQTRTLLFLLGWSLLISVIQALMLQRQHSLWFVGATLAYLICLQLVLGTDTVQGISRTLSYGLLLVSLLNLSRIQQVYDVTPQRSSSAWGWFGASLLVVAVLAGVGWYSASKAAPTPLMQPVSWTYLTDRMFELYNDDAGMHTTIAKSGYGHDDSSLGGPLQSDSSIVFTAKTPELTYWRGESKSFYTSKGWTQKEEPGEPFVSRTPRTSAPTVTQEVLWSTKGLGKQLFYGGTLLQVDALLTEQGKPLAPEIVIANQSSDKITLPEISDPLSYYKITSQPVREDPGALTADSGSYPDSVTAAYLQLPANLPRTIRGLAEQITTGSVAPYAKAVAIEQYLRTNYTYSLDKPTRPTRNEDFVSHFLFVDQLGYCDHFSTAMVVMLRSVGVPARWVKGFAPGTLQGVDDNHLQEVAVSNKDAHSWVEVYFPSSGWVPFEPTPGFTGASTDHAKSVLAKAQADRPALTASIQMIPTAANFSGAPREWLQTTMNEILVFVQYNRKHLLMAVAICLLLLGLLLMLWRKGWLLRISQFVPGVKGRLNSPHPATRYMDRLWLQLFHRYGAKSSHQTVREYVTALRLGNSAQQQALLHFAQIYETIRYDTPGRPAYSKREIAALWKAIQSTRNSQK